MEIIIEYTLLTSMVANFFSLTLAERIVKKEARLKWLSSLFGGIISVVYPLFHMGFVLKTVLLFFVLIITTLISFKYTRFVLFMRDLGLIFIVTCLFGGINEALCGLLGELSLLAVCGVVLVSYWVVKFIHKSIAKENKIKQFTYKLKIVDGDKVLEEEGYLDSGNVLCDSVTKKPIILINFDVFHKIYEEVSFISAVTKNYDFRSFKNGHFEKINGVGGGNNILVFTVDKLFVGEEKSFRDVMLGLSFSGFEKSFGKGILLNSSLI